MEDNITITIEGEGLSLTKKTNLQKVGQIISFLGFDQTFSPGNAAVSATLPQISGPNRGPARDVISTSEAKTYAQKITALALYLRDTAGQDIFMPQEIRTLLKKMGDEPKNFTRDLNSAIELQYIVCVDATTEQYELTGKGEEAVNAKFTGVSVATKKPNGTKRPPPVKGIRDEIKEMQILASQDGLIDYHKLSTKGDKILWILSYADKKGIDALTPAEVDHLSGQLRDRINSSGFTALNDRNVKSAFVAKTKIGFQLQKKGTDYLASLSEK